MVQEEAKGGGLQWSNRKGVGWCKSAQCSRAPSVCIQRNFMCTFPETPLVSLLDKKAGEIPTQHLSLGNTHRYLHHRMAGESRDL